MFLTIAAAISSSPVAIAPHRKVTKMLIQKGVALDFPSQVTLSESITQEHCQMGRCLIHPGFEKSRSRSQSEAA
jgi:hypothetical protein